MAGAGKNLEEADSHLHPMAPIATVQSCFSTLNGTPRQPLLVPLARACVMLNPARAPPEALEGLADYSHCWLVYVFHLNTDLEKLWREPSRSKFKAKPVLDIKPYLPYSDYAPGATVTKWLMDCWAEVQKNSLYASSNEFQSVIKQVLSCDIRSVSQRNQPHNSLSKTERWEEDDLCFNGAESKETSSSSENSSLDVAYHLILEGVNITYRIDCGSHVNVEDAKLSAQGRSNGGSRCNYTAWEDIVARKQCAQIFAILSTEVHRKRDCRYFCQMQ